MIRTIRNEDFKQWSILWEGYNQFYKRTVLPEVTAETWKRFQDPNEPMHALVFEENGQIQGFVHYLFHRHTASLNNACYLQDLFTAESQRGQGVGQALIEEVSKRANEAGTPRIYWLTHETNETARKLYDRIAVNSGFIVYGKRSE